MLPRTIFQTARKYLTVNLLSFKNPFMCCLVCILETNAGVTSESRRHGPRPQHQRVRSVRDGCCIPEPSAGVSPQEDYQADYDRRGLGVLL